HDVHVTRLHRAARRALDHRFGWSRVPVWTVVLGDVLMAIGYYFIVLVSGPLALWRVGANDVRGHTSMLATAFPSDPPSDAPQYSLECKNFASIVITPRSPFFSSVTLQSIADRIPSPHSSLDRSRSASPYTPTNSIRRYLNGSAVSGKSVRS